MPVPHNKHLQKSLNHDLVHIHAPHLGLPLCRPDDAKIQLEMKGQRSDIVSARTYVNTFSYPRRLAFSNVTWLSPVLLCSALQLNHTPRLGRLDDGTDHPCLAQAVEAGRQRADVLPGGRGQRVF